MTRLKKPSAVAFKLLQRLPVSNLTPSGGHLNKASLIALLKELKDRGLEPAD
jgi:hypothetical protein